MTSPEPVPFAQPPTPHRALRTALAAVAWFNLLSALAGAAGLTIGGGLGIPLEWLEGSPFDTYVWPGVILGVVVGGVQVVTLVAQFGRFRLAWGMHAAAGLVMMIWIFVEIAMLLVWSPLHGIYFVAGLVQTVLAVLALGAWPRPFLARAPRAAARAGTGGGTIPSAGERAAASADPSGEVTG